MTGSEKKISATVYLVGGGPGDEGLITVRGLELLRRCQVVIYDELVNDRLVEQTPPGTERIALAQRSRSDKLDQDRIHELMLDRAQQGKTVVRLKGGDPYMFGRGSEEALFLAEHGIRYEVVPGVTAGIAAPMAAGIAVTRRDLASCVTFVTGHGDLDTDQPAIDYQALAALIRSGATVCFYMAVAKFDAIAAKMQQHGLEGATPVCAVQWGFTPRQRSVRTTLADAADRMQQADLTAPAIIVVGKVAGADPRPLEFYTSRPLFGQCIVITRTRKQASQLHNMLTEMGALVLEAPMIELVEPRDWAQVDQAIREISQYDWLILTSVSGVQALAQRLDHLGLDSRHLAPVKVAVIGDATQDAVHQQLGIRPDLVPPHYVGESLAQTLIASQSIRGQRILMLRADIARSALRDMLTEAGAQVTDLTVYETRCPRQLPDDVLEALRQGRVDWITFTSSSTAANMAQLLGDERHLLRKIKTASIGPITSATLGKLGMPVTIEADPSNLQGLIHALRRLSPSPYDSVGTQP